MKLDCDCVRDILLYVEENTDIEKDAIFKNILNHCFHDPEKTYPCSVLAGKYGYEVVYYHLNYCLKAGLVEPFENYADIIYVSDLTPDGHEFLANIRDDTVWNNIKEVSAKVGSKSLDALVQISSNVITTLIRAQFNI